jgi:hypothetical protein
VKPRDYEHVETVDAPGPYAVWMQLKESEAPLQVGDILESDGGELRIYKYVGFEQAQWQVVEAKPAVETGTALRDQPAAQ